MKKTLHLITTSLLTASLLAISGCQKQPEPVTPDPDTATTTETAGTSVDSRLADNASKNLAVTPPASTEEPDPAGNTEEASTEEIPSDQLSGFAFTEEPRKGNYKTGQTICFDSVAYLTYTDGVYELRDGVVTQLFGAALNNEQSICTDGYTLYFVDTYGDLWEIDLTEAGEGYLRDSGFIPFTSIVGAGNDCVYMRSPDTLDPETGVLDEWGNVYRYYLSTRESEMIMEHAYGECAGGYTYARENAMDAGPGNLRIFDYQGNELISTESALSVSASLGTIWYSVGDINAGYAELYYMENNKPVLMFSSDNDGRFQYGYNVDGFLISHMYEGTDDYVTDYYDLRNDTYLTEEQIRLIDGAIYGGYMAGDHAYYTTYNAVYAESEDGLTLIYQQPENGWYSMSFSNNMIILDSYEEDIFYLFEPLPL